MTRLARFEVKAGNYVLVEIADAGSDRASHEPETDFANAARVTFDEVLSLVRSMADNVASGMKRLRHPATDVDVEFFVRLGGDGNSVVLTTRDRAHFTVSLRSAESPKTADLRE